MSKNRYDVARPLGTANKEKAAQLLASDHRLMSKELLAKALSVKLTTAGNYLDDQQVKERSIYLQRHRLRGMVARALGTMYELMGSEDDRVRLRAAQDVLDRCGMGNSQVTDNQGKFEVVFNLPASTEPVQVTSVLDNPIEADSEKAS